MSERLDWERARFVDWPADRADAYRAAGMWAGQTLFDAVAGTAGGAAEHVAVIDEAEALSYSQLVARAERVAGGLRALGLARGDAAVVQLPNTIDFVLAALACFRVGVRPVMALPALRLSELDHLAKWIVGQGISRRTLGGAMFASRQSSVLIGREWARISPDLAVVPDLGEILWDRRFLIQAPPQAQVVAVGRLHGVARREDIPSFVQQSLPAVVLGDGGVIIPHLAAVPGVSAKFIRHLR